jgi:hypothetical protein
MCCSPLRLKDKGVDVPCGKCGDCQARRISGWSFRILKEAERSSSAFFITLTYSPEHCPITNKNLMTLRLSDIQTFFKSLRKENKGKIKYYCVGEYGGITKRPHYHLLILNLDYQSICDNHWKKGHVYYGSVTPASAAYCLKYMSKESKIPQFKGDNRLKEFATMSKKLGENYITQQVRYWHKIDLLNRCYIPMKGGQKIAMPRYYKEKIYTEMEKMMIAEHMQNVDCGKTVEKSRLKMEKESKQKDLLRIHKGRKAANKRLKETI